MTLRIKNWSEHQHFKDRNPPWIKLHKAILERLDINALSDSSFRVLIGLWLLASEDKDRTGALPPAPEIAFRLRITEKALGQALTSLKSFLIQDDINAISERCQGDAPEKRREEAEKEAEKKAAKPAYIVFGEFQNVRLTQAEYDKLCTKHGEPRAKAGIAELGAWLKRTGRRRSDHYACMNASSWVWEKVDKSGAGGACKGDPAIADYAKQLRRLRSGAPSDEKTESIKRLYSKIRDTIGPDGLARVKEMA
jgi:hypothetical protein